MNRFLIYGVLLVSLFACSNTEGSLPSAQSSTTDVMKEVVPNTETAQAYMDRFNSWFIASNKVVSDGYEKASSEVVLEDGGEWGCDWEMDAKAINAASRKAVQSTDLLDKQLQQE